MPKNSWTKYLPRKIKIGVSGRFSPIYGSVEWKFRPKRTRRKRIKRRRR